MDPLKVYRDAGFRCCTADQFADWWDFARSHAGTAGEKPSRRLFCHDCWGPFRVDMERQNRCVLGEKEEITCAECGSLYSREKILGVQCVHCDAESRNEKYCSNCRQSKPKEEFAPEPRSSDGLYWHCRDCKNKETRKRRAG